MGSSEQRLLVVLAGAASAWLLLHGALGTGEGALYLAPLLLLLLPLLRGRYPGETSLLRLAERRGSRERVSAALGCIHALRAAPCLSVRGGRLLGAALAVRPPPSPARLQ